MTEVKTTTIQERFQNVLVELMDFMTETVAYVKACGTKTIIEPCVLCIAKAIVQRWDATDTIKGFLERSLPHWDKILKQDRKFLTENLQVLFNECPRAYVTACQELLSHDAIPTATIDSMFAFLTSMVRLCIRFIHEERKPVDGKYTVEYHPELKVSELVKQWQLTQ